MTHGYEPTRISNLTQQSRRALGALDAIHSTDPAASQAMQAIAALRSVIADGIIPATMTIDVIDPLGRHLDGAPGDVTPRPFEYTPWDAMSHVTGEYPEMSDEELLTELERLQYEGLPVDEHRHPDMEDPFWVGFEPLARELARRSATDGEFADRLTVLTSELVLIPYAVAFAEFEPPVVADMVVDAFRNPRRMPTVDDNYRAGGAELLLHSLGRHPEVALELLADPVDHRGDQTDLLAQMLSWPLLDPIVVRRFLDGALGAPFTPPQDRDALLPAGEVLADLIELANGGLFPNGFPPDLSPTIAKIVVQYLPFWVTSLGGDVQLKDFEHRDLGIVLGDYEEMVDLIGALMRDPVSLVVLEQAILVLAALSAEGGGPLAIQQGDIANYSRLLRTAASNEQLEEALEAADDRRIADTAIDLTFGAVDRITSALGPAKAAGVDIPFDLIENGARAIADGVITETDLGLDDLPMVTALLVVLGMAAVVVRMRDDAAEERDDDDETLENIELARDLLDEIQDDLSSGASLTSNEGRIEDLARVVREIDADVAALLDHDDVKLPEEDPTVDQEE